MKMAGWRLGFLGVVLWIGCQEGGEEPLAVGGTEAIAIGSQEELVAWAATQKEAFVVQGDLLLEDAYLSSLEPLRNLVGIEGDFAIRSNGALTDLKGLHNLGYVEGDFHLLDNGLIALAGLERLERVGKNFEISRPPPECQTAPGKSRPRVRKGRAHASPSGWFPARRPPERGRQARPP